MQLHLDLGTGLDLLCRPKYGCTGNQQWLKLEVVLLMLSKERTRVDTACYQFHRKNCESKVERQRRSLLENSVSGFEFGGFLSLDCLPMKARLMKSENRIRSGQDCLSSLYTNTCRKGYQSISSISALDKTLGMTELFHHFSITITSVVPIRKS